MTVIKNCNENDFENEVLKSNLPVIVDFWAEWCGPCKMLTPILEELSNEMKNEIKVVKVNLDENQDLACLLYTSPSPRDRLKSRMPSSA